jgi:hypothetical protein
MKGCGEKKRRTGPMNRDEIRVVDEMNYNSDVSSRTGNQFDVLLLFCSEFV